MVPLIVKYIILASVIVKYIPVYIFFFCRLTLALGKQTESYVRYETLLHMLIPKLMSKYIQHDESVTTALTPQTSLEGSSAEVIIFYYTHERKPLSYNRQNNPLTYLFIL